MSHFIAKKSLGQNFLTDPTVATRIVAEGGVVPGDIILEIGPGTGKLTEKLLAAGGSVVAVEADERAVAVLAEHFAKEIAQGTLVVHHADIRTLSFASLGLTSGHFKLIANIPYYISGLLFRKALEEEVQPSVVVFLVQKEVAERIAREKKESLLSLSIKAYGTPRYAFTVKKGSFAPQPKVDSAVIAIEGISRKRFDSCSESAFFEALHLGFAARRKQLFGALKEQYGEGVVARAFDTLGISRTIRGEDLSIDSWMALAGALRKA